MDTQVGSMKRPRDSASRMTELEKLFAKVTEENKLVVDTLYENKGANNSVQDKLAKEQLTSLAALRQYDLLELEVQQLEGGEGPTYHSYKRVCFEIE